jgi:hypothetical protein
LGADAVNLVTGEKPADVYTEIAARVLKIMQQDAEEDPETFPNATYAKLMLDQVFTPLACYIGHFLPNMLPDSLFLSLQYKDQIYCYYVSI